MLEKSEATAMSSELVTVATFNDPVEAAMARNYLESGGVHAFLLDEETVATTWGSGTAVSGIKLQVNAANAEQAEVLLDELPGHDADDEPADMPVTAFATAETMEELREEEEASNPKNDAVDRIFRATVAGLVIWPLQFPALWMLMNLNTIEGEVSADRRWKVWASVFLNLPLLTLILAPLFCCAGLFPGTAANR
jgi:hypothetical protein